jgi:hypothetical protein
MGPFGRPSRISRRPTTGRHKRPLLGDAQRRTVVEITRSRQYCPDLIAAAGRRQSNTAGASSQRRSRRSTAANAATSGKEITAAGVRKRRMHRTAQQMARRRRGTAAASSKHPGRRRTRREGSMRSMRWRRPAAESAVRPAEPRMEHRRPAPHAEMWRRRTHAGWGRAEGRVSHERMMWRTSAHHHARHEMCAARAGQSRAHLSADASSSCTPSLEKVFH